jgi:hypothetical protein
VKSLGKLLLVEAAGDPAGTSAAIWPAVTRNSATREQAVIGPRRGG